MERAIICGWFELRQSQTEVRLILGELQALAEAAGAVVVGQFHQKRERPDRAFLIGRGKANEMRELARREDAGLIIFYNVLSSAQLRNLEEFLERKVIDRTRLILDIFALRARSLEGKLQVELAQLLYLLPRLTGHGIELSRLGGGIGTRGPGETKLEVDRRTIRKRITLIKRRLQAVLASRQLQQQKRQSLPVPRVSLVGYTSAGKSTLFQALSGQEVLISPRLFATLDPLLRRVDLDEISPGYYFLLSDTVGFIRSLPQELFTAFRATLEETAQADTLLHVVDLANPDHASQKREVEKVLTDMAIAPERVITVYNKIDLLEENHELLARSNENDIYVSAKEGIGLRPLKEAIFRRHFRDYERYRLEIPEGQGRLESFRQWAIVLSHAPLDDGGLQLDILCSRANMLKFKERHDA